MVMCLFPVYILAILQCYPMIVAFTYLAVFHSTTNTLSLHDSVLLLLPHFFSFLPYCYLALSIILYRCVLLVLFFLASLAINIPLGHTCSSFTCHVRFLYC